MVTTRQSAIGLIAAICALPGNSRYLDDTRSWATEAGIARAVASRDTPTLFRWMMDTFSYQGISDEVAAGYISRYGNADCAAIQAALTGDGASCPKLISFEAYRGCSYRKGVRACGNPDLLASCAVPRLPLRKGSLNELAFSLYLFMRDRCGGDLVGFIDLTLQQTASEQDQITAAREALLSAMGEVRYLSRKVLSMSLAVLLIGAGQERVGWANVGASMVAVDSLVHNFMHRTGILAACGTPHPYGERCYAKGGCEALLRDLASRIDARAINPAFPATFPRMVQHAIWRFCAIGGRNVCNGRNINDQERCALTDCPVWPRCGRIPLRPRATPVLRAP